MSEGPKSGERTIQVAITGEEQVGADRPEPTGDALIAGRYRVQRRIGKGGMGEVMAARDEQKFNKTVSLGGGPGPSCNLPLLQGGEGQ